LTQIIKKYLNRALIILFIITLTASVSVNYYLESVITNKLKHLVENELHSKFDVEFGNVSVSIFRRNISIKDIRFNTKKHSITGSDLKISLDEMKLEGICIRLILFQNSIKIRRIVYDKLSITTLKNNNSKSKLNNKNLFDFKNLKLKNIDKIEVNNIQFIDFSFTSEKFNTQNVKETLYHSLPYDFNVTGLIFNKSNDETLTLNNSTLAVNIDDIVVFFDGNDYKVSLDKFYASLNESRLQIINLQVGPLKSVEHIANKYSFSKEIYSATLDTLDINKLHINDKQEVYAKSINIAGLDLAIFNDKSKPQNTREIKQLPHIVLKRAKSKINIDTFAFKNSKITIKERIVHKDSLMQFFIDNITGEILNISNHKLDKKDMNLSFFGKLMGTAPVNLKLSVPLNTKNNYFHWEGHIGPLKFRTLDKVLYPVLGLKILSGELNSLDFKAMSNNFESQGELTMLYKNLHASILKSNSSRENHFLTSIANGLIHKSNPNKRGKVKTVRMYHERNQYKGLGNYIWKTLQNGIINTITPVRKRVKKLK